MRTLPSSPATPPPKYLVISEFDAAGSFGVDPVTGEVFIATKLDFDNRYVNCHTDNGPPIENGSVSCRFRSPGFITGDFIVAIEYPLVRILSPPGKHSLLGKESVWRCPDPILLLLRLQSAE